MVKKVLITMLLLLFSFQSIYALELKDLDYDTDLGQAVLKMVEAGIINGYPDGTFRQDDYVKRSEFIKILNKTLGFKVKAKIIEFKDIKETDWYYEDLLVAIESGYINGFNDGTFRAEENITREQFCKIIATVLDVVELPFNKEISDDVSEWARPFVNKVVSSRIMLLEEDNKFRAKEPITRGEVCAVLANYIVKTLPSIDNPKDEDSTAEDIVTVLSRVNERLLSSVIPNLSTDAQKQVCQAIYDNIKLYLNDTSHDYKSAAEQAYNIYQALSEAEKTQLQNVMLQYNTLNDIMELKEFFFPEI